MDSPNVNVPPKRFSTRQLAELREISSEVDCECPNHLSSLVERLGAFEDYSADCESRNAEDAALHAHLYRETAKARAIMEEALEHLVRFEGIEI